MVAQAVKVFTLYPPLIAVIAMLIGGVIVANLMLISVNERTGEIGLRKAIGARSPDIMWQFVMEAGVVALTGGLAGIRAGPRRRAFAGHDDEASLRHFLAGYCHWEFLPPRPSASWLA